ncbi:hypothetical protein KM043_007859 [Ampulex compressa]|nr:hypothetical protein KM043_007859 [Ampulex compressa]
MGASDHWPGLNTRFGSEGRLCRPRMILGLEDAARASGTSQLDEGRLERGREVSAREMRMCHALWPLLDFPNGLIPGENREFSKLESKESLSRFAELRDSQSFEIRRAAV